MKDSIAAGTGSHRCTWSWLTTADIFQTNITNVPVTRSSWSAHVLVAIEPSRFYLHQIFLLRLLRLNLCSIFYSVQLLQNCISILAKWVDSSKSSSSSTGKLDFCWSTAQILTAESGSLPSDQN